MKFMFCFSLIMISQSVFGTPISKLEKIVLAAQQECPRLNCPQASVLVVNFSGADLKAIDKDIRARIKDLVVEQARNLWPDTILEGPYTNADRYRIEVLQKLSQNGQMIGFHLTYSDKAWDLDTCQYDPAAPESRQGCETGRIYESAFIDAELTTIFRDAQALANFVSDRELGQ